MKWETHPTLVLLQLEQICHSEFREELLCVHEEASGATKVGAEIEEGEDAVTLLLLLHSVGAENDGGSPYRARGVQETGVATAVSGERTARLGEHVVH